MPCNLLSMYVFIFIKIYVKLLIPQINFISHTLSNCTYLQKYLLSRYIYFYQYKNYGIFYVSF